MNPPPSQADSPQSSNYLEHAVKFRRQGAFQIIVAIKICRQCACWTSSETRRWLENLRNRKNYLRNVITENSCVMWTVRNIWARGELWRWDRWRYLWHTHYRWHHPICKSVITSHHQSYSGKKMTTNTLTTFHLPYSPTLLHILT